MNETKTTPPAITKEFNGTPDVELRPVVSKAEMTALESQRKPLVPQHNMPGPDGAVEVNSKVNQDAEDKVKYIRERLAKQRGRARNDYDRTQFSM